jgi:hypothetical protein
VHIASTIHNQDLARNKIALIAGKKENGTDQVFRLFQPSKGGKACIVLGNIIGNGSRGLGIGKTGRYCIDPDIIGAQFRR